MTAMSEHKAVVHYRPTELHPWSAECWCGWVRMKDSEYSAKIMAGKHNGTHR